MWINLSSPNGAFASPYLQLHSRVDCIEPFDTRVVTRRPRRKCVSRYISPLCRQTTSEVVLKFFFAFFWKLPSFRLRRIQARRSQVLDEKKKTHTHSPVFPTVEGGYRNWSLWLAGADEHSESSGGVKGSFYIWYLHYTLLDPFIHMLCLLFLTQKQIAMYPR